MPKIFYKPHKFVRGKKFDTKTLLEIIIPTVEKYAAMGLTLTLRQLYYQLVTVNAVDNNRKSYEKIIQIVKHARNAGLIDWDHIHDPSRNLTGRNLASDEDPVGFMSRSVNSFNIDWLPDQKVRPFVFVEKNALVQIVARAAMPFGVDVFAMKGYLSTSAAHDMAQHFKYYSEEMGQKVVIVAMSDHDPSGWNLSEEVVERWNDLYKAGVEVRRVALTMEQIEEYNPPPFPAKMKDSRYSGYVERHGTSDAWELDALNPQVLDALIKSELEPLVDPDLLQARKDFQAELRVRGRYEAGVHIGEAAFSSLNIPAGAMFPYTCVNCDSETWTGSERRTHECPECLTVNYLGAIKKDFTRESRPNR